MSHSAGDNAINVDGHYDGDGERQQPPWKRMAHNRRQRQYAQIREGWRLPTATSGVLSSSSLSSSAKSQRSAIPIVESCGILTPRELEITQLSNSAATILAKLHNREWTSVEVTTAFCKRAALLQQVVGCLTEIFFDAALARARELDEILQSSGTPVGPLHGLPFSVKDNHDVEGLDSTVGWVGLIGKPAAEDHPSVKEYRRLGAVLYVKTNVPQSMMMSDSYNHVFGQSVNSLNRNLISGGSSGGEAALIAGGGSVLGVGTDIGGSVRIPAALQGLFGLSPTGGRIGNRENIRSQKYIVPPVAGPLTRDIDTMEIFLRALFDAKPWERDPGLLPILWREQEFQDIQRKRLKIGYVIDDGVVLPQPPVQRAVRETVARLEKAGHEVFEWDCATHRRGYDLWLKGALADGGKKCADLCKLADEPLIEGMLVGKEKDLLDSGQKQELADEIWTYQRDYMKRWTETGVDAVIMPVTQWVGMKPKVWVKSDMYVGYTALLNLLNWTALSFPAGVAASDLDRPDDMWKAHKARSFHDGFNHNTYDPEEIQGMPVGLQIVTGRFGEERALGIAKVLSSLPG